MDNEGCVRFKFHMSSPSWFPKTVLSYSEPKTQTKTINWDFPQTFLHPSPACHMSLFIFLTGDDFCHLVGVMSTLISFPGWNVVIRISNCCFWTRDLFPPSVFILLSFFIFPKKEIFIGTKVCFTRHENENKINQQKFPPSKIPISLFVSFNRKFQEG